MSPLHRPDIGFTPSCPPHFTTKLRPWLLASVVQPSALLPCIRIMLQVTDE